MGITAERVVFPRAGEVAVESFELPEPGPYGLLLRTERTAISAGTELTTLLGDNPRTRYPAYPGYSHVGVVERVGERIEGFRPGDRVLSMGRHQSHVLLDLTPTRPGGPEYAEPVPDGLAAELAALAILGSVSLHGVRRAELQLGQSVAVFGQGIVGQLIVQLAKAAGCSPVVAIDLVAPRLEEARLSGADAVVDASRDDVEASVASATGGRGAEAVFDATRTPKTLPVMMRVAAMGGKVLMVGSVMGTVEIDAFTELQLKELSIVGCFQPAAPLEPHHFLPWTQRRNRRVFMELTARGRVRLEHLITHRVPYRQAPEIYAMIRRGGSDWLGVVFTWDER
jgi:2-desacetyl-2-hydroxyethyl bacteriochlorophyllide A dehydrogenase